MDQIAEKLRQEIDSLEGTIQLTEETAILRHWVQSILEPLDKDGHQIPENELNQVIEILQQARQQYNLDGELDERLESVISRYTNGSSASENGSQAAVHDPDADPFDFLDEDDEEESEDSFEGEEEEGDANDFSHDPVDAAIQGKSKASANGSFDQAASRDEVDFDEYDFEGDETSEIHGVDFGADEGDKSRPDGLFDEQDGQDDASPARNGFADGPNAKAKKQRKVDDDYDDYDDESDESSDNRIVDFGLDADDENRSSGLFNEQDDDRGPSKAARNGSADGANAKPDAALDEGDEDDYDSISDFDQDEASGDRFVDFGKDEEADLFDTAHGATGADGTASSPRDSPADAPETRPNDLFGDSSASESEEEDDDYGEAEESPDSPKGLFAGGEDAPESGSRSLDREAVDRPQRGNTIAERAGQADAASQGRRPQRFSTETESKIRDGRSTTSESETPTVEICSARVGLKELFSSLDIQIPQQDVTQLNHALKNKFQSKPVIALQNNPSSEGQYVLIPRLNRFFHKGQLYSCTVKNLARTYFRLFADIKDLTQYKGAPFLNSEAPNLGWAIVMREAQRDSLDKDFMQQNQCMRQLANAIGTPSHFVRRRSLVEAIYDLIVGRLVLDEAFLTQTIDWTASGPSKSEFVCTYYSDEGIRLRHWPRTQHNRALGVCPNW